MQWSTNHLMSCISASVIHCPAEKVAIMAKGGRKQTTIPIKFAESSSSYQEHKLTTFGNLATGMLYVFQDTQCT